MKALDETGYVRRAGIRKTKAGFETVVYELTLQAYLALALSSTNLEMLLARIDESATMSILGAIAPSS